MIPYLEEKTSNENLKNATASESHTFKPNIQYSILILLLERFS